VALSELLVRLVLASRAVDRVRPTEGGDLSPHAVRAALYLFRHGHATVSDLAEGLGVSMGWASRIADELERAGRVVRERDPLDRRVVRLHLSPTAAALAEDVFQERGEVVAHALADLSPQERATVTRFLHRLIDEMESLAERGP
jgi:DNA-binding MarR family transcriptional regulator